MRVPSLLWVVVCLNMAFLLAALLAAAGAFVGTWLAATVMESEHPVFVTIAAAEGLILFFILIFRKELGP